MQANVQYGGQQPFRTRRVYYGGTTALKKFQPVAFVEDADAFSADPGAGETDDQGLALGRQVETPTSDSAFAFAGLVSEADAGKTESWITIFMPTSGEIAEVRVESTTDISVGDHLNISNGNPYFTHQDFDAESTKFYALEARTADSEGTILAVRY